MNKAVKEEYFNIINTQVWVNDSRMQSYIKKKTSSVLKSESGIYVDIEKPSIKTRFCFSEGYNGVASDEDTKSALDSARVARSNQEYFIRENTKEFDSLIKDLEDETNEFFFVNNNLRSNVVADVYKKDCYYHTHHSRYDVGSLTKTDRANYIALIKAEKEKFVKRLNTYLKRYGLTKVHSWTYIAD